MSGDARAAPGRPGKPAPGGEHGGQDASNPHIPAFMAQVPWYMSTGDSTLEHQRKPDEGKAHAGLDDWYVRGQRAGPAAKKFRKGACENCGAMSHKTKECMERPRKRGARWTGKDIRPVSYTHLTLPTICSV